MKKSKDDAISISLPISMLIVITLWILIPWIWIFINIALAWALIFNSTVLFLVALSLQSSKENYRKGYNRAIDDVEKTNRPASLPPKKEFD